MSLIKEINILGIVYKVEEVQVVCKKIPRIGEINYMTQVIKIDSTLSEERKKQVLIRETLHGVLELLGLDEINDDEKVVQSIATALYQVFSTQAIFS